MGLTYYKTYAYNDLCPHAEAALIICATCNHYVESLTPAKDNQAAEKPLGGSLEGGIELGLGFR